MAASSELGFAVVRAAESRTGWWRFAAPERVLATADVAAVAPLLAEVERAVESGSWAVGFVAYEAAPGFDPHLTTRASAGPLAFFGLVSPPTEATLPAVRLAVEELPRLVPRLTRSEHAAAVASIHAAIARGETYQVNFTFPLDGALATSPERLFLALAPASRAPYAAYLDLGPQAILSLSPELFFAREGERLEMRPMKGTRRRGRFAAEDRALAAELAGSAKERAENLMIVDMVRNDLGRVAATGSVRVEELFVVDRHPTVWQMTSTVVAASAASAAEVFRALFPCASVTGAPKVATMRAIAALERAPRGVYCGAIGWLATGRRARFAVGIRTAVADRGAGTLRYDVGSGIVWDSRAAAEYDECLAKALAFGVADEAGEPFRLFETLRVRGPGRVARLAAHLARLAASAEYFDFHCDRAAIAAAVRERVATAPPGAHRLRVELAADGAVTLALEPLVPTRGGPWRLRLAERVVQSGDAFLFHKTTRRALYDAALADAQAHGADEPLLCNERGELTEGARTSLIVELDGERFTPALGCGLLPGVARARLLASGRVRERVLRREEISRATRLWLVNSLRGCIPAVVVDGSPGSAAAR